MNVSNKRDLPTWATSRPHIMTMCGSEGGESSQGAQVTADGFQQRPVEKGKWSHGASGSQRPGQLGSSLVEEVPSFPGLIKSAAA